jgi:GNAT superfamily N-acetyltransferase
VSAAPVLPAGFRLAILDDDGSPDDRVSRRRPGRQFAEFSFMLAVLCGPDGDEAGFAEFGHLFTDMTADDTGTQFTCSDVFVSDRYRRRGLATAMYVEAERLSGRVLVPSAVQRAAGRALWLQSGRPFGRGVPDPDWPTDES